MSRGENPAFAAAGEVLELGTSTPGPVRQARDSAQETQKRYRANFGESRLVRFLCLDLFFKHHGVRASRPEADPHDDLHPESSVKNSFASYF
jgi:hypothetical protein